MEATIYLITNNVNGKKYVGFTTWSIQRRDTCVASGQVTRKAIDEIMKSSP
jgi:hypothetical protein